ncbi:MAG: serine hydrolase [Deltaproteobacteria bacterium]|nr:serine hydrolase [Deltaproteobacteria bacterium]
MITTVKIAKEIDALFSNWDKPDSPGCAIGIVKKGELIYSRGYGMANIEHGIPITANTVFTIASVSKQFTAACILLLVQSGKLTLDDDIRQYIPELPRYEHPISIRHLIHHCSGLKCYVELWTLKERCLHNVIDNTYALDLITRQRGLNFQPGSAHLYCNTGYLLLGEIIGRVSGKSLVAFAEEKIFTPLGMTDTRYSDDHTLIVKNSAGAYDPRVGGGFQHAQSGVETIGGGGVMTTIKDLSLWDRNFYHPTIGGEDFAAQMTAPGILNNGRKINYAFGLVHGQYQGLKTIGHTGQGIGFRAHLTHFPEQAVTIICLANLGNIQPEFLIRQVADLVFSDLFQQKVPARVVKDVSMQQLQTLSGDYWSPASGMTSRMSVKEGNFWVEVGGNIMLLKPTGEMRFEVGDEGIHVAVDEPGRNQPARTHIVTQTGETDTFEKFDPVSLDKDQLAEYTGDYYCEEIQVFYRLSVHSGQLYLKHKGAYLGPFKPGIKDVLFLNGASFKFSRNKGGDVTGLLVNSGRARKIQFSKL